MGWVLAGLLFIAIYMTILAAAEANDTFASSSKDLTEFRYDQGYLIRRGKTTLPPLSNNGGGGGGEDGGGGRSGGGGGGTRGQFMSYGLGSTADEAESRRFTKNMEECREAMSEISAMIDKEGSGEQIAILSFPITPEFVSWYFSLAVTVAALVVSKYFEFMSGGD
jgi:hypothetical protein